MLYISRLVLRNWRTFPSGELPLQPRMFLVGPNSAGKSNVLDAIRFLRDVCRAGGGLQRAVRDLRGGLGAIRPHRVRDSSDVALTCEISDDTDPRVSWRYALALNQEGGGIRDLAAVVKVEEVWRNGERLLARPRAADEADPRLRTFTALEQAVANREFRPVADLFSSVRSPRLAPGHPLGAAGPEQEEPGSTLGAWAATTNAATRASHLRRMTDVLRMAEPRIESLELLVDDDGRHRFQATLGGTGSWRTTLPEDQLSDGTARLLGLLWSLLEGRGPLLLEQPETSLHPSVTVALAEIIRRLQQREDGRRQVITCTHSLELLSDPGIAGGEIAALWPLGLGTSIRIASSREDVRSILLSPPAEQAPSPASPPDASQLLLDV